jgi:hypothetical protein
VSDAIIAGTYRDSMGKQYLFETNGQATFPARRQFDYTLALDHVLTGYDYIYSKKLGSAWMMKTTQRSLRSMRPAAISVKLYPPPRSGDWRVSRR